MLVIVLGIDYLMRPKQRHTPLPRLFGFDVLGKMLFWACLLTRRILKLYVQEDTFMNISNL